MLLFWKGYILWRGQEPVNFVLMSKVGLNYASIIWSLFKNQKFFFQVCECLLTNNCVKEVWVELLGIKVGCGGVRLRPVGSHAWASMAAAPGNGG